MILASVGNEIDKPPVPQIAIEVQTSENTLKIMRDKAKYYLANGSRMVLLIYPPKQLVEVQTPEERYLFTADDVIDMGDVLPGFKLTVRDIFPQ
jgi:Uma2 family endonuclease